MQSRTLNKITREFFSHHPPVYEESISVQKNIIAGLREKIKEKKNLDIRLDNSYVSSYRSKEIDRERYLSLEISNPYKHGSWYDRVRLVISFEKEQGKDKLYIKPTFGEQAYNFSGKAADLFDFFDLVLEKYREIDNRKTKTEKIKKLKKGAVLARIKELAQKKQFNFYLEEFSNKLKLSIQIGEQGIATLDILYSKFQQEMWKIEGIVDASRELGKSEIVTKLNFTSQNNAYQINSFTQYDEP